MFNFTINFPSVRNLANSSNKLTETEISENVNKAETDALNYVEDFANAIVENITNAVDNVINNIVSTANSVANNVSKLKDGLISFIEDAEDNINLYIDSLTNTANTAEIDTEKGIDSFLDFELNANTIKSQNGVVQKNITGNISDLTSSLTNVDKRNISMYADEKAKKIQEIKQQCTDKLVEYAKETSLNKFESNVDMDNIVTDLSIVNYDNVNIKQILVSISNDEQQVL